MCTICQDGWVYIGGLVYISTYITYKDYWFELVSSGLNRM